MTVRLVPNPDIIASVARAAERPPCVVAFAAETQDLEAYARRKREKKGVDYVVANDVSRTDIGFGSDSNEILLVGSGETVPFGPANKLQVARFLIEHLADALDSTPDTQ